MPSVSLVTLKNGLHRLKEASRKRKQDLETRLSRSEKISSEDEHWLDNEANHVDEDALVTSLQEAADYEAALKKLTPLQNGLAEKLRKLAYDSVRSEPSQASGSGKAKENGSGKGKDKVSGAEVLASIPKKRKRELFELTSETSITGLNCRAHQCRAEEERQACPRRR